MVMVGWHNKVLGQGGVWVGKEEFAIGDHPFFSEKHLPYTFPTLRNIAIKLWTC